MDDEQRNNPNRGRAPDGQDDADMHRQRMLRMLENQRRYMEVAENSAHLLEMLSRVIPGTGGSDMEMESVTSASSTDTSPSTQRSTPSPDINTSDPRSMWSDPIMACQLMQLPFIPDTRQRFSHDTFPSTQASAAMGRWRTGLPLHVAMGMMTSSPPLDTTRGASVTSDSATVEEYTLNTSRVDTNRRRGNHAGPRSGLIDLPTPRLVDLPTPRVTARTSHFACQTDDLTSATTSTQTARSDTRTVTPLCSGGAARGRQASSAAVDLAGLSMAATQSGLNTALADLNIAANTIRQAREMLAVFGCQSHAPGSLERGEETVSDTAGTNAKGQGSFSDTTDTKTRGGQPRLEDDAFPEPLLVKSAKPSEPGASSTSPVVQDSRQHKPPVSARSVASAKRAASAASVRTSSRCSSRNASPITGTGRRPAVWSSNLASRRRDLAETVRKFPRVWGNLNLGETTAQATGIGGGGGSPVPVDSVNKSQQITEQHNSLVSQLGMSATQGDHARESDSNSSNSSAQRKSVKKTEKLRRTVTAVEVAKALETAIGALKDAGEWGETATESDFKQRILCLKGLSLGFPILRVVSADLTNNKSSTTDSQLDQLDVMSEDEKLDKSWNSREPETSEINKTKISSTYSSEMNILALRASRTGSQKSASPESSDIETYVETGAPLVIVDNRSISSRCLTKEDRQTLSSRRESTEDKVTVTSLYKASTTSRREVKEDKSITSRIEADDDKSSDNLVHTFQTSEHDDNSQRPRSQKSGTIVFTSAPGSCSHLLEIRTPSSCGSGVSVQNSEPFGRSPSGQVSVSTTQAVHGSSVEDGVISDGSNSFTEFTETNEVTVIQPIMSELTSESLFNTETQSSLNQTQEPTPERTKDLVEKLSRIQEETVVIPGLCEGDDALNNLDNQDSEGEPSSELQARTRAIALAQSFQRWSLIDHANRRAAHTPVDPRELEEEMNKLGAAESCIIQDANVAWDKLAANITGSEASSTADFWKEVQSQDSELKVASEGQEKVKRRSLSEVLKRCTSCFKRKQ